MELLAILIALVFYAVRGSGEPLQRDGWFAGWHGGLAGLLGGTPLQLVVVLAPAGVVMLLYGSIDDAAYGIPALVLLVVALIYSFGRGDLGAALEDYLERWSRRDFQAAFEQLEQGAPPLGDEGGVIDPAELHLHARRRLYYRAFERLFAVLFWFVLLGPGGAVLYRLVALEQEKAGAADGRLALLHWMDWLPSRLLGISFALVGDFDATLYRWQESLGDPEREAVVVLEGCGNAALRIGGARDGDESVEALVERGATELESIQNLNHRALAVWLVLIALLAMIG